MDRHVEFASHLSHLVALYAHDPVDHAAERAALRAARAAAKHGDVDVFVEDGLLHAGHQVADVAQPELRALKALFDTLGIARVHVVHQAKQDEIKHLAQLLGEVAAGVTDMETFAGKLGQRSWSQVDIAFIQAISDAAATDAAATETDAAAAADVPAAVVEQTPDEPSPTVVAAVVIEAPASVDAPPPSVDATTEVATAAIESALPAADALMDDTSGAPLAEELPPEVAALAGPEYRELFERLITSSEPGTLRRLLEPVQQAIELTARSGAVAVSVHLVQAMFACEACAADEEMRRQFVVTLRRLTKPMLLRAFASLYWDEPREGAAVEQVLARFGEDGAEAAADRVACAPTLDARAAYVALLGRLPGAADALLAMLDDERDSVVERAIELMVRFDHPELERALGEALGHASVRVRQAAARGLAALNSSAFAADALVRAAQDASADVRLIAAVALQSRRETRLAAAIVALVDDEPEVDVQLALVTTLGRLAAPEGVQKLIAIATADQRQRRRYAPALRLVAIEAMGEARTPAAMVALQKLLEDREKDVREAAARLYTRARRQTASAGIPVVSDS